MTRNVEMISSAQLSVKYRQECARVDPRGGDTPSNGLRKEAPPEKDAFYRL